MGNTLEIVHHIVFSFGPGMWGIKMENRHWSESVWGFRAAAEWIQGEKRRFQCVVKPRILHYPLTLLCHQGILHRNTPVVKYLDRKYSKLFKSALMLIAHLSKFSFQNNFHGNQPSWRGLERNRITILWRAESWEASSAVAQMYPAQQSGAFVICHICWVAW